jgi:cytochrome c oxidase subunit 3
LSAVTVESFSRHGESRRTSYVGMVMALASWTMLFASLFFAYAVLRLRSPMWPPEGVTRLPRLLPFVNTLVLLASSVTLHRGTARSVERSGALRAALGRTIGLGALFLALQLAVWIPIFYGLTVFHALHVLAGLVVLAVLLPGAARGRWVSGLQTRVRLSAMFWHFVDAVWVLMFVTIYLL